MPKPLNYVTHRIYKLNSRKTEIGGINNAMNVENDDDSYCSNGTQKKLSYMSS